MAKNKIIKDLANGAVDTITALKRTKVLVSNLGNSKIMKWLDYEIAGYPQEVAVPFYRIVQGNLVGTYFIGSLAQHLACKNVSIPLGKMPQNIQQILLNAELREGVEALRKLEQIAPNSKEKIAKIVPADFFPAIANYNNNPHMIITSASVIFSVHMISNILSVVENKLLDILLLLEQQFGSLDNLDIDIASKSTEEIDNINKQIIVIYNDQSVFIGNGNKIKDTSIASEINK